MVAAGDMVAGRYRVESVLVEGGARSKCIAMDEQRWRKTVLEVVPVQLDATEAEAFTAAMQKTAAADHPGMPELYDFGVDPTLGPWLAAAPMEGAPLEARLASGPLPAAEVVSLAHELLAALGAAHDIGLQHLALRPAEIFLEEGLDGTRARLLGLGLVAGLPARFAPPDVAPWLAPERARGDATDARADVYGVAAVMYAALGGGIPYAARADAFAETQLSSGPEPLATRAPGTPPALAALVERCLSVDPSARPGSAAELTRLLTDLDRAAGTPRTMALDAQQLQSQMASAGGWHPAPNQAPIAAGAPSGARPGSAPGASAPTNPVGTFGAPPAGGFGAPPAGPVPVAQASSSSSSNKVLILVVAAVVALPLVAFGGIFVLGIAGGIASYWFAGQEVVQPPMPPEFIEEPSALPPPPSDGVDRAHLPVTADMPSRGPSDALVTIVMFSDFQCPFCSRVEPTITRLVETYPQDVRVVWRDHPLSFHQNAMPAAELAREAYTQGGDARFWQAHDLLFANQRQLDRPNLERFGAQLGLDPNRVRAALDQHPHRAHIQADAQAAQALGARGTPSFFLNGRPLAGAQPYARFDAMVTEELDTARGLVSQGVPRSQVYAHLTQNGRRGPPPEEAAPDRPSRRQPDPNAIYRVPVGDSPTQGPDDALVTIVAFSEFQCPFCNRVRPTLDQVRERYGRDVRIVFKHNPLAFHDNAMPAAEAASEVYARRGDEAFFRYHDVLFENQRELTRDNLVRWARAENVAVGPALDDHRHRHDVAADQQLATSLGARGTPSFFINGRNLRGAQPFAAFQRVIDEEMTRARAELARGTPRSGVYMALTRDGHTTPQFAGADAAPPSPTPPRAENGQRYTLAVPRDAPSQGPANAPVTIQVFSDFQCPFCSRLGPTLTQVRERYPRRVRIVWRNYPLPFHDNAMPAAEAAMEVHAQGGDRAFWAYHDLLFENQRDLTRPSLERFASQVGGIDMRRFRAALDNHTHRPGIQAEMVAVQEAGARIGTPSSFINGSLLSGAQPFSAFQTAIDRELNR